MQLNYERARHMEGEMVRYKKDGMEIVELNSSDKNEGYGYGFWRPWFVPFGVAVIPFFWW